MFIKVTPLKINMEHVLMEVWKIIFLSKWRICRFQPFIFQGVNMFFNEMIILSLFAESFNQTDSPHGSQNSSLTMARNINKLRCATQPVTLATRTCSSLGPTNIERVGLHTNSVIVEYPTIFTCFFRSYNSANGKLFAWGPVVWIPGIPLVMKGIVTYRIPKYPTPPPNKRWLLLVVVPRVGLVV